MTGAYRPPLFTALGVVLLESFLSLISSFFNFVYPPAMQICYDQISAVEVNEAFQLREAGHQRLRKKISTTSITVFVFSLYFPNSEDVITFVEVQPIQRADSRHVFFDVNVLYDTVNISRVIDNAFIDAVQCIYDVYIQASRWTFDHHECVVADLAPS